MARHAMCLIGLLALLSTPAAGRVTPPSPVRQLFIAQAGTGPLRINELATQVAESLRLKMLSAIANGDDAETVSQLP